MTILRDGKTMGTYEISDLDEHEISRLMVGREVSLDIEKAEAGFWKDCFLCKGSGVCRSVWKDPSGSCVLLH